MEIFIIIALVLIILLGLMWIVTLVRKVGPNEALIIYGSTARWAAPRA